MDFYEKRGLIKSILKRKRSNTASLCKFIVMKPSKKYSIAFILTLFCIGIHFYSTNHVMVENVYSERFFPPFSSILRWGLGSIPFSIGDVLYGFFICWLIMELVSFVKKAISYKSISIKEYLKEAMLSFYVLCTAIYIVFNIFWGINYNRKGIAWQIDMPIEKYKQEELGRLNAMLLLKVNESKKTVKEKKETYPNVQQLFEKVSIAYDTAAMQYSFLHYRHPSIKSSLWGWLGNYLGFSGYYNPFTGEAQVNTSMPKFLQPFVACHEVAHQLGYAKEDEASFVGFIAAMSSKDTLLHYSSYLDLFMYANRNLYYVDSVASKKYRDGLSADVQADIKEWREFNFAHQNPLEPMITWVYDKYLKGNEQQGMMSYNQVTALLIAYYKKKGDL